MPPLKFFEKIDPTRFRRPAIDTVAVEKIIAQSILKSWQSGYSAQQAEESVLSNEQLIQQLAKQASRNLDFQKQISLQTVQENLQHATSQYEEEKKKKLEEIDAQAAEQATAVEKQAKEINYKLTEDQKKYSATQASLKEMRARVNEKLKSVKGAAGLETLLKIRDALQQDGTGQITAASMPAATYGNQAAALQKEYTKKSALQEGLKRTEPEDNMEKIEKIAQESAENVGELERITRTAAKNLGIKQKIHAYATQAYRKTKQVYTKLKEILNYKLF